jgi:solute carrier family 66 (lysosomal lysine-arginine transporter), member 1
VAFSSSISIACWVVVFSPQIIENFRRSSADGLSLQFLIVWLLGDVFNILGAVLQGVLPTMVRVPPSWLGMSKGRPARRSSASLRCRLKSLADPGPQVILAIYYTIADVVLLCQCFYYRGFTWRDEVIPPAPKPRRADERTALLLPTDGELPQERRGSDWSIRPSHLSPAVPLVSDIPPPQPPPPPPTVLQTVAFNGLAVLMVCGAGVAGWWLSRGYGQEPSDGAVTDDDGVLEFDVLGQAFGYLCAVFYLGSRIPQILLNWRRKSTEGVSMLFFLFACLGNLTYVLSIFAYGPHCGGDECQPGEGEAEYAQYILVNLSWLAGSLGTLFLDIVIFVQFFMYSRDVDKVDEDGDATDSEPSDDAIGIGGERWDPRPLLQRNASNYEG